VPSVVVGVMPDARVTVDSVHAEEERPRRSTRAGRARSAVNASRALVTTPPAGRLGTANLRRAVFVTPLTELATTFVAEPVVRLRAEESVYASSLGVMTTVLVVVTVVVAGRLAAVAGAPVASTPPATARTVRTAAERAPRRRWEGEGQNIVSSRGGRRGAV